GNRADEPRRSDGSILQALGLMNSPFVESHLQIEGAVPNQLIARNLSRSPAEIVNTLFLAILSRYPTTEEMTTAASSLQVAGSERLSAVQDLVWSLYNKVDFVFNF